MISSKIKFNKIALPIICLCFIFNLMVYSNALYSPSKTIRVGIITCPQICFSEGVNHCKEYSVEYLSKISQFTNWNYEFVEVAGEPHEISSLMQNMLNSGQVDIIAPLERNISNEELADFSGCHYVAPYSTISVLNSNDTVNATDPSSLNGCSIAVLGHDAGRIQELDRFCVSNNITYKSIECNSIQKAVSMVESGAVDAVLSNTTLTTQKTRVVAKFSSTNYFFAVKKGNSEILGELNVAMNKLDETYPRFVTELGEKCFEGLVPTFSLSAKEQEYISKGIELTVALTEGEAPLQYANKKGEALGISKLVMDEISHMTGLKFNYKIINSISEIKEQDKLDVLACIPLNTYSEQFPSMILSKPYLQSSTIMYLGQKANPLKLEDKIFAAMEGDLLPPGVKEGNTIYYKTREDALNAVEKGYASYGYGNAYSVVFYSIKNTYKNLVTIPQKTDTRDYCIAVINDDKMLSHIINKSVNAIDEKTLQKLIFEATSNIDINITPAIVFETYSERILAVFSVLILVLIAGIISYVRTNTDLMLQNKRYEVLSEISNDYLYEYNIKQKRLCLSEKTSELVKSSGSEEKIQHILTQALLPLPPNNNFVPSCQNPSLDKCGHTYEISLPFEGGVEKTFRATNSCVYDSRGRLDCIIGKITDISKEIAERTALISKAQIDGLTGLYNASTSKILIIERVNQKPENEIDAFILMDLDLFKSVNDVHGHYTGDQVLQDVAKELQSTFRTTDIIGRVGGDEFCIYMKNIPSADFLREKCRELNKLMTKPIGKVTLSASLGIVLVDDPKPYEELFRMADDALYQTKRNTKGRFVIFGTSSAFGM